MFPKNELVAAGLLVFLTVCAVVSASGPLVPVLGGGILLKDDFASDEIYTTIWTKFGEGVVSKSDDILHLSNAHVSAGDAQWEDYELEFRARVPLEAEEAQIFASVRYNDDMTRYVIGLRGGNNNDIFVARYYKKYNLSRLLKIAPLDFVLAKDVWYNIRVQILGFRMNVFLDDEQFPRVSVADHGTPLTTGRIALGGGWNPVEFDHVQVKSIQQHFFSPSALLYNFQNLQDPPLDGYVSVDGSQFNNSIGFGFNRLCFTNQNRDPTGDPLYDKAVGIHLGRTSFLQQLPNDDYLVTLQMGWNREKVQSIVWFQNESVPSLKTVVDKGDSAIIRKSVSVVDGELNVEFLRTSFASYISWMAIERRADVGDDAWNNYISHPDLDLSDTAEQQSRDTNTRSTMTIASLSPGRSVHDLNGDWLFLPAQEVSDGQVPWSPHNDTGKWHIMDVPNFWTPHYAWTYLGDEQRSGSANWAEKEKTRCESYTFDFETTKVAFYKKHIVLPFGMVGRTMFLIFDGIGMDGEIWVNGQPVGVHSGLFTTSKVDVSEAFKGGLNTIVVKVGEFTDFDITDPSISGVLEREPIERKTSTRYPTGMLFSRNLGIWQGVKLTISGDVTIEDTFFRPGLNDYDLTVTVANRGSLEKSYSIASQIRSYEDNGLIYDSVYNSRIWDQTLEPSSQKQHILSDNSVEHTPFRNWSPESPNLYTLDIFAYRYNEDPAVLLSEFNAPILKLNFQPDNYPTPPGWSAAGGNEYEPSIGCGWNTMQETRSRGNATDPLFDALVTIHRDAVAVFSCDIPNGEYVLSLQFGDSMFPTLAEAYIGDSMDMEKVIVKDVVDKNNAVIVLRSLTVENEKLQISIPSMPSPGIGTSINWLVLEERAKASVSKWELGLNHFDILDEESYDVGFRTFEVQGDDFRLNGHPYKLRGANHCPNILRPNDADLSDWFTKKMNEKNINFSRSHSAPMNDIWLRAASKNGVAISQEGTWPWLMKDIIPSPASIRLWQREWLSLVNKHKNHPSLLMWTMNNEMKLFLRNDPETWEIVSTTIQALREIDPTRPIVADSGYARKFLEEMGGLPDGIDDGDVDDVHKYYNWYDEKTFFYLRDGETFSEDKTPGRPYISQELSTGYPDADSGHPIKHYIYRNMNPQAWVGRWAYDDKDPRYFLDRHALITKETSEVLRSSYRQSSAGVMMFALNSWFQNVYDVNTIAPWPTLDAVSKSLEPVMACIHLHGRNFYVGAEETVDAFVVNDSADRVAFTDVVIEWQIVYGERVSASGSLPFAGSLAYFENFSGRLTFELPSSIPETRVSAKLQLLLHGNGRFLSSNEYDITICEKNFSESTRSMTVAYLGGGDDKIVSVMERSGLTVVHFLSIDDLLSIDAWDVVVIGKLEVRPDGYERLLSYMARGGQVLFHHNGPYIAELFPTEIFTFHPRAFETVTPVDYGRSIFSDINPTDLSWFYGSENIIGSPKLGSVPFAASGMYNVQYGSDDVLILAETTAIHGYREKVANPSSKMDWQPGMADMYYFNKTLDEIHGSPLFTVRNGVVSCMLFEADGDPIANKLLINVLEYLKDSRKRPPTMTMGRTSGPNLRPAASGSNKVYSRNNGIVGCSFHFCLLWTTPIILGIFLMM